uniref:Uncharacterized protein n=1 Tax=viral metagenome TaxID=1070528 RepID=A0A6M3J498_9ZZZZ
MVNEKLKQFIQKLHTLPPQKRLLILRKTIIEYKELLKHLEQEWKNLDLGEE